VWISDAPDPANQNETRVQSRRPQHAVKLANAGLAAGGGFPGREVGQHHRCAARVLSDFTGRTEATPLSCWIVFHSPQRHSARTICCRVAPQRRRRLTGDLAMRLSGRNKRATSKAKTLQITQQLLCGFGGSCDNPGITRHIIGGHHAVDAELCMISRISRVDVQRCRSKRFLQARPRGSQCFISVGDTFAYPRRLLNRFTLLPDALSGSCARVRSFRSA